MFSPRMKAPARPLWTNRGVRLRWDRPTVRLGVFGVSVIGYLLCVRALLEHGIHGAGGAGAVDVLAYWTAGRHIIEGTPIYAAGVGGYAAFLYPPVLAQLFAPLAMLPFTVAVWAWRAFELACLRVAVGSWKAAGIALLVWPPVIAEIDAGNVHLPIAAAVAMTMRGDGRAVFPVAMSKFASLAALPLAWRTDRHGLRLGLGLALGVALASFAIAPDLWMAYPGFIASAPSHESWYNIGASVPLGLRIVVAAALSLLAVRWARLLPVAAVLSMPVLWVHGLSVLVALAAKPPKKPDAIWQVVPQRGDDESSRVRT
jgi:hypothetical protein